MTVQSFLKNIFPVQRWMPHWLGNQPGSMAVPQDLNILETGIVSVPEQDEMDYLWFNVNEHEGNQQFSGYRVVRLLQLRFLPLEARSDPGLLQKMRTVLRGLYGSKVSFLYLAAGIFTTPNPVGIAQCYGVSAFGATLEEAIQRSARSLAALRAALGGAYRQLRLEPLNVEMGEWIFLALEDMPHVLVTVGHPNPRENARSSGASLPSHPLFDAGPTGSNYTFQQNEILYRGMSEVQEDFLFLVLTSPIALGDITEMLTGLAEETSTWAAWQNGTRSVSFGVSLPAILSGALAQSAVQGTGVTQGESQTQGEAHSTSESTTQGSAHTQSSSSTTGWAYNRAEMHTQTQGSTLSQGQAQTSGQSLTTGEAVTHSSASANTQGVSSSHVDSFNWGLRGSIQPAGVGIGANAGWGIADGTAQMSAQSEMTGTASTLSQAETLSQSTTTTQGSTVSQASSQSQGESWGVFGSQTQSNATTVSQAKTTGTADTLSSAQSRMAARTAGQSFGRGASSGLAVGVAPAISASSSYQWQYDPAILVTHILRQQQALLNHASKEGAYYTDVYALTRSERGKQALMGLIPEAFHGVEEVITGVQTRDLSLPEQSYIGKHAKAFTPSTRIERIPGVISGYMDSTILTMLQLAAYTAPGMFEQGRAMTVQESTPDFAFHPGMPGDVVLGSQWSSETGEITSTQLRLTRGRHFHTAFCGDTGFGKSVAAERLAYESTLRWKFRTIVLDFGQGWRRALNWGGMDERVDIQQLFPGALRPLRWNILQVPQRIQPGRYRSLVSELFANAGRMGPRQLGFMRRALTQVYNQLGVLTSDPEVTRHPTWGRLQPNEVAICQNWREMHSFAGSIQAGMPIDELQPGELAALAVHRSKLADVRTWVERLKQFYNSLPKGDQASRASLEGVLLRVEQFAEGQMATQYGAPASHSTALPIEDLGLIGPPDDPWGLTIVEGGAEMDEYPKAALLALLSSVLYFDSVVRRRESLAGASFPPMQIFFEEANKVLTGVSGAAADQNVSAGGPGQVSEIFQTFWRDGRKYQIYLHVLAQTISALPPGILSSCNNGFFFQTKHPQDRDLILAHIGRSEKGIANTEYKRYLARIPRGLAIAKLGYSDDVVDLEPMLIRPWMVPGSEPHDREILERLGALKP